MNINILSVDFQNDFCSEGGVGYHPRDCHSFIRNNLIQSLRKQSLKIAEIISDYRFPVANHRRELCVPGERGYESQIPIEVKHSDPWIKCRHNPAWVRENGGFANKSPGPGHPDPELFSSWLENHFNAPEPKNEIILIGLVLDGCVMCTGQELSFRGYKVRYLFEAVDCFSGSIDEKQSHLKRFEAYGWGKCIYWNELQRASRKE
ncbi:isochorismatase family protein [bacterium]|nr:isochorismatase family protein [bacterium]